MPQRFLRPGITTSDQWNSVSFPAQSLYIRILTLVDDFGRYDARVPILHGQCFALRPEMKPLQTAALRSELHSSGLITVYVVDGKEYLQIEKWQERARCEASKFPDKPESAADGSGPQDSAASLAITSSPLHPITSPSPPAEPATARKRAARVALMCPAFAQFWTAYPNKTNKGNAEDQWTRRECAANLQIILSTLKMKKASEGWTKEGGRFIPNPAKWLAARGWEDEAMKPDRAKNGALPGEDFTHLLAEEDR